ncbi:substrate-binding domain-containing protein [Dermatophilaceae bacterium Sec6.4]
MQHSSDVVGLVLARPARMLGIEPFFAEFIAGLEERLSADGRSLLLRVVADHAAEMAEYRRWAGGSMIEAVVVANLHTGDLRVPLLLELGLPAVAVGGTADGMAISNMWVDNAQAVTDAVTCLAHLGHEHIARVSGPKELHHTRLRDEAFAAECERRSIRSAVIPADYSEESGRDATLALLRVPQGPTAIIYDNDVMALAGLAVAATIGRKVPTDLSILAWDDSTLCRLSNPSLSAMTLDVHGLGIQTAGALLDTLAGSAAKVYQVQPPHLSMRGSTAVADLSRAGVAPK